ncbi:MAG TPA: AAA family ATPase [Thermoflexia bacterium]|nr:AAA family ATPase [Thermoflexia bacterium]
MELRYAGAPLRLPATARSRSLLAYLIVHRERSHPRERLADLFWPDRPRARSLRSLSTALWRVRRTLPPGGDYILADPHTVQFNPRSDYWLDVEAFEQGVQDAKSRAQDAEGMESCLLCLATCIELYRGDFLEGFYDDWCLEERYRLEGMYLGALERLMVLHEALDQPREALRYGDRLLACDPLREDVHRAVIRLQVRLGNRAEAVRQARWCRAVLWSELGAEPAPETVALCDRLLGPVWRRESSEPDLPRRKRAPTDLLSGILDHPPFVGRQDVWKSLLACWERAAGGEGCLAFIGGEAGIGKSRLVGELSEWVRQRGGWTAQAGCYEYERALPHGPLADLLRALLASTGLEPLEALPPWQVGELARLAPGRIPHPAPVTDASLPVGHRQAHLFDALVLFLVDLAERNPLLLVLEDLHWAHDSTLAWLHYLARRLPHTPILVLATYRREEIDVHHPLRGLILRLEQEGVAARLELPRLSREALSVWMAGAEDGLVERVYLQTEGNPFFTLETLRALFETGRIGLVNGRWVETGMPGAFPIPTSVCQVVRERLDRLSPPARRVAEVAAVVGRAFDLEVLEQAWGRGKEVALEALDELLRRRLIREEGDPAGRDYAFDHHLVREVIYRELHHRRRQRLHRRVGEAMERLCAEQPEVAAELAYHFEHAQEAEKALFWLVRAGEQARRGYAYRAALRYFRRAIALMDRERADELAARALSGLAIAHWDAIGEEGMQWEWLERALEIWKTIGDRRGIAETCYALAYRHADFERARKLVRQGLDAVEGVDGLGRLVSYGYGMLARFYEHEGDFHHARLWAERQLELSQRLGDESGLAYAHHRLGSLLLRAGGPMEEAATHEREAVHRVKVMGWTDLAAGAHSILGNCLLALGRTGLAEAEGRASLRISTASDIPWRRCWALHLLAEVAILRGRWEEGLRIIRQAEEAESRRPAYYQEVVLLRTRGWLAARRGDLDEARALMERALEISRRFYPRFVADLEMRLVAIDLDRGEVEAAYRRLTRVRGQIEEMGTSYLLAFADRLEGRLAACRGDLAAADRSFAASLHRFQALDQALEAARTRLVWGRVLLPRQEDRARRLLQAALKTFEAAEADPEAEEVRRLLSLPRP